MNTKKKNKNRQNKPPNPVPPQKSENLSENLENKISEPGEKDVEKLTQEIKIDERVPIILTKDSGATVGDKKENETDTPKKPKRNRGKKKKQEKDVDDIDDHEIENVEKPKENVETHIPLLESKEKVMMPAVESEVENIAPNARKKKSKNKKQSERTTEDKAVLLDEEPDPTKIIDAPAEDKMHEKPFETIESKKKNKKKKNRNDSEKSDKAEDLPSCTSAFKKLIDTKEEMVKEELKSDVHVTDDSSISEATVKEANISEKDTVRALQTESLDVELLEDISPDFAKESGVKNKKKIKKDKKLATSNKETTDFTQSMSDAKLEPIPPIIEIPTDEFCINEGAPPPDLKIINMSVIEKSADIIPLKEKSSKLQQKNTKRSEEKEKSKELKDTVTNVEIKETLAALEQIPELLPITTGGESLSHTKEKSPKPQAKIAKPVEKKQKDKDHKKLEVTSEPKTVHGENKSSQSIIEMKPKNESITDETIHPELKQTMTVQTKIREDASVIDENEQEKIQTKPENIIVETKVKIESSILADPFTELSAVASKVDQPALVTEIEENITLNLPDFTTHEEEDMKETRSSKLLEDNKNKKRKKSPKPPVKNESTEIKSITENIPSHKYIPTESISIEAKPKSSALPCLGEPEFKIEEKILTAETTPDVVEHPRSTSELADNNNNSMIIKEIASLDETKIVSSSETLNFPFIQGSGETPLASPEIVQQVAIQVTEIENVGAKPKPHEKTDLKSKVLEVNKDMEELRKSIERSLAELTSIETSEQNIEERFTEEKKTVSTPAMKTSMSSDMLSKSCEAEIKSPYIETKEKIVEPLPKQEETQSAEIAATCDPSDPPICPARKDNKGKGKSKKKGKQDVQQTTITSSSTEASSTAQSKTSTEEAKKDDKAEKKSESEQKEKGKQQASDSAETKNSSVTEESTFGESSLNDFEPIESFDDALTSSVEDVNTTFEIIANEANVAIERSQPNPEINITAPDDTENEKKRGKPNPVSQPKNLLGHPDIPVPSNKTDYKKEKNKIPNEQQAKVKIRDAVLIESKRQSTETQTDSKRKPQNPSVVTETVTSVMNDNEEYIYKYSFRKVYLPSACHVCTKDLKSARVACGYCNLLFYCSAKHKDENWPQHQAFCFAVSTITHLKNLKYIYADAKEVTGHNYRLLRMQMIISCEKVLKRKLAPWEQEVLLYPRMCADPTCREWRQNKLTDCEMCGQMSFCTDYPEHLPKFHQRWCKSYSLYQKLVTHQQTKGRLETKMPSRVMKTAYQIPDKINMVLASLYEEKIDMNDVQYAALTQLATAPLTAAYCHQLFTNKMNAHTNGLNKKSSLTLHVVGAELQFEADVLHKWEAFLLHVRGGLQELHVVLIAPDLNPSNLPLELLGKISLCNDCKQNSRKLTFGFQDKKTYYEYWSSNDFTTPDLICAFNPSVHRSAAHNGNDPWPASINCILKQKAPFVITSYTITELNKDLVRIRDCSKVDFNMVSDPKFNNFASVRPDRNFISDDEMPLLFKNYCYMVIVGAM